MKYHPTNCNDEILPTRETMTFNFRESIN